MHKSLVRRMKQQGYTLLELLFGLGLGLFLLANGIFMYSAVMKSYYDLIAVNRLDNQLRTAMNLMVQEIRRAGYSASAINNLKTGTNTNPFMASSSDLTIPNSSCILFSYDSDSNGLLPAVDAVNYDKRFGFRLSGTTLQSRGLTSTAFNCTDGTWTNMTDSNLIQITNLTFTLTPAIINLYSTNTLSIRNVTISVTGNLTNDTAITRTITGTVRVRNDKFIP